MRRTTRLTERIDPHRTGYEVPYMRRPSSEEYQRCQSRHYDVRLNVTGAGSVADYGRLAEMGLTWSSSQRVARCIRGMADLGNPECRRSWQVYMKAFSGVFDPAS